MYTQLCFVVAGDGVFPDLSEELQYFSTAFDHKVAQEQGHIVPQQGVDAEYDEAKAVVHGLERELEVHLREVRAQLGYGVLRAKANVPGPDRARS